MQMQTDLQLQIMTLEESVTKLQDVIQSQSDDNKELVRNEELSTVNLQALALVKEAKWVHKQASIVSAARSTVWEGSDRSSLPSIGLSESHYSVLRGRIENWRTDAVIPEDTDDKTSETKDTNTSSAISIFSNNNGPSTPITRDELDSDTEDELDWEVLQNLVRKANHFYDLGLFSEAEKGFRDTLRLSQSLGISKKAEFDISQSSLKLARSCLQQQKLRESEAILLELLDKSASTKAQRELRLDAYYTLSELYLLTRELAKAKAYCKKSVAGRRKLLGHDDKSVYDAIHMLVFICIVTGEKHEADALSELLPQQLRANQWLSLTALQAKYDSALQTKSQDNSQLPSPKIRTELPTGYEEARARRGARNGGNWTKASSEATLTETEQVESPKGQQSRHENLQNKAIKPSTSQDKMDPEERGQESRLRLARSTPNLRDQIIDDGSNDPASPSLPVPSSSSVQAHHSDSETGSNIESGSGKLFTTSVVSPS